jgi:hypothetical protein
MNDFKKKAASDSLPMRLSLMRCLVPAVPVPEFLQPFTAADEDFTLYFSS